MAISFKQHKTQCKARFTVTPVRVLVPVQVIPMGEARIRGVITVLQASVSLSNVLQFISLQFCVHVYE